MESCQKAEAKYKVGVCWFVLVFLFKRGFQELAKYYAEDPTKVSPEEFFTIIDKFLTSLKGAFEEREAAKKDEEKKAKLEEKKAARKVAAASKKKKVCRFGCLFFVSPFFFFVSRVCSQGKPKDGVLDNIMEAAASGAGFRDLRNQTKSGKKLIADPMDATLAEMGI